MAVLKTGFLVLLFGIVAGGLLVLARNELALSQTDIVEERKPMTTTETKGKLVASIVAQSYGTAPELTNSIWINSEKPLRFANLRGSVVLLEFWTFGCYNCKNTLPAMKSFYEKYSDKGLVIIGDHYPEFAYESEVKNVEAFVKQEGIKYPVAIDNEGITWRSYRQRYWPTMYLIDKEGAIRYVAIGEHDYSRTEEAIKALLAE